MTKTTYFRRTRTFAPFRSTRCDSKYLLKIFTGLFSGPVDKYISFHLAVWMIKCPPCESVIFAESTGFWVALLRWNLIYDCRCEWKLKIDKSSNSSFPSKRSQVVWPKTHNFNDCTHSVAMATEMESQRNTIRSCHQYLRSNGITIPAATHHFQNEFYSIVKTKSLDGFL